MIFLSPNQEKNLCGLDSDEDEDDHEPGGDGVGVRHALVKDCHCWFICWGPRSFCPLWFR